MNFYSKNVKISERSKKYIKNSNNILQIKDNKINNKMLDIFEVNCIIYNMYVLNSSKATRL